MRETEIDADVARQLMQDMQLMFVKLGKLVDPSVENPLEIAYNEVIQYANALEAPITLERGGGGRRKSKYLLCTISNGF
jgi:hypothetical protein